MSEERIPVVKDYSPEALNALVQEAFKLKQDLIMVSDPRQTTLLDLCCFLASQEMKKFAAKYITLEEAEKHAKNEFPNIVYPALMAFVEARFTYGNGAMNSGVTAAGKSFGEAYIAYQGKCSVTWAADGGVYAVDIGGAGPLIPDGPNPAVAARATATIFGALLSGVEAGLKGATLVKKGERTTFEGVKQTLVGAGKGAVTGLTVGAVVTEAGLVTAAAAPFLAIGAGGFVVYTTTKGAYNLYQAESADLTTSPDAFRFYCKTKGKFLAVDENGWCILNNTGTRFLMSFRNAKKPTLICAEGKWATCYLYYSAADLGYCLGVCRDWDCAAEVTIDVLELKMRWYSGLGFFYDREVDFKSPQLHKGFFY
jgi:hypothetical protein